MELGHFAEESILRLCGGEGGAAAAVERKRREELPLLVDEEGIDCLDAVVELLLELLLRRLLMTGRQGAKELLDDLLEGSARRASEVTVSASGSVGGGAASLARSGRFPILSGKT